MKVFISWSGTLSHQVASAFRDWLPSVVQSLRPYLSSEDIDKGARWSTDIAQELEESHYGLICVTPTNIDAPWINFEAGALSKSIDKANVTPFLFRVKRSEIKGPLLQFQSAVFEKVEMLKLLHSINNRIGEADRLRDDQLARAFDVWWPKLEEALNTLPKEEVSPDQDSKSLKGHTEDILEELLELARSQERRITAPDRLLPPDYLQWALGSSRRGAPMLRPWLQIHEEIMKLEQYLEQEDQATMKVEELRKPSGHIAPSRSRPARRTTLIQGRAATNRGKARPISPKAPSLKAEGVTSRWQLLQGLVPISRGSGSATPLAPWRVLSSLSVLRYEVALNEGRWLGLGPHPNLPVM